jgi:hypothetical protein
VQHERRDHDAARDERGHELGRERAPGARHLGAAGVQREDRLMVRERSLGGQMRVGDRRAVAGEVAAQLEIAGAKLDQPQPRAGQVGRQQRRVRAARQGQRLAGAPAAEAPPA